MVNKFRLDSSKSKEAKEVIARTLEIANNYAGELSIEVLPLDKIELDPENNRELALTLHDALYGIQSNDLQYDKKKQDWKSLESLAKTIADDQLINPIYVYRYGNKCRLIAGERRTLASAIAGKKEIIARIASQRPIGTKLKVLQWIENNERVDLTLAERISSIEAILKEYFNEQKNKAKEKITGKLIADLTGMSMTQARRYILILQASPNIKKAIDEGKLENIKLIELILSIENSEHQQTLLNAALSGASFDVIIKLKTELESDYKKKKTLRGRKPINVNLGNVKPHIAKIILNSLSSSKLLNETLIQQLQTLTTHIQWSDCISIENSFKKIITILSQEAFQ